MPIRIACHIRNRSVLEQTRTALTQPAFEITSFDSAAALWRSLRRRRFDLVVLDASPVGNASDARPAWPDRDAMDRVPTLVLSLDRRPESVAHALYGGADDALGRPFAPLELEARVYALLRRHERLASASVLECKDVRLERTGAAASCRGSPVGLSACEFRLAWLLFSSPGVALSGQVLGAVLRSLEREPSGRALEQHIRNLRRKLRDAGCHALAIRAAQGGYRLDPTASASGPPTGAF